MCHTRSDCSGSAYIYIPKECGIDVNPPSHPTVGGVMSRHAFSPRTRFLIRCRVEYAADLAQLLTALPHLPG